MKCLNPECGSWDAEEINVSVNVSHTEQDLNEDGTVEYVGDTDYGDLSDGIGTECRECNEIVYLPDWEARVLQFTGQATVVLPA
jgi:hypothetical protein